jgi:hypothetical protein
MVFGGEQTTAKADAGVLPLRQAQGQKDKQNGNYNNKYDCRCGVVAE